MRRIIQFFFVGLIFIAVNVMAAVDMTPIEMALLANDWDRASQLIDSALPTNTDPQVAIKLNYWKALCALKSNKLAMARTLLISLMDSKADEVWRDRISLAKIDSYYLEENYEEALVAADELLQKNPKTHFGSLLYFKLAKINLKLANWDQARQYLNKILTDFPLSLDAVAAKQFLEERDYFSVQVGSFSSREKALQVVLALQEEKEYAYILEVNNKQGKRLYRVRVGRLANLKEAQALREKLIILGYQTNIFP